PQQNPPHHATIIPNRKRKPFNMPNVYYVILAGGSGTRLWPLSRTSFPKHLLDLRGQGSMLQETVQRILPITNPENIFIVTETTHANHIITQLPTIPKQNIIIEPDRRETGPCIALAASIINAKDPNAIMVSLHSDHVIKDEIKFRNTIKAAIDFALETKKLITLGIVPKYPETGYGYIETDGELASNQQFNLFTVKRFTEKPDEATAQAFIASGKYFWNSGIFIWNISTILEELKKLQPEFFNQLTKLQEAVSSSESIDKLYLELPKKAIEYLVLEPSDNVAVIPVDFGWSDIGSFQAVKDMLSSYPEENLVQGEHLTIGSRGCLIHSPKKLVATIGLQDMVIIDTDDILLICPKDRSQDVKQLVLQLKKSNKTEYL
ncbi:MAG: mannose-1-phosphate guanylyltransferase, partial [bacterium]